MNNKRPDAGEKARANRHGKEHTMDIRNELTALSTPCVSDASGGLNNMDPRIRPLDETCKMCGPALTVRLGVNDNKDVLRAIRSARPGDVLVIDAKGSRYNTVAGDFTVGMAKMMGVAGIVADGSVRDSVGVRAVGLPVFCLGATIAVGGKAGQGEVNVPVSCGGVPVMPGDWILGDADGVTVIPQNAAERIIADAKEKERRDEERSARVLVSREAVAAYLDSVLG
jgi:regulator of RNase E activity RraA